jgi:hypothetical protein
MLWGGGINNTYTVEERAGSGDVTSVLQVDPARFFKYAGAVWLSKCNLYDLRYETVRERTARRKYKRYLSNSKNFAAVQREPER